MMNAFKIRVGWFAVITILFCATVASGAEKLRIFILAGQSNMVGHARAHTIATLYASDSPRDKELLSMVIKNFSKSYYPPRSKKVLNVLKRLNSSKKTKLTLGGCLLEKSGNYLYITKEMPRKNH